MFVENAADIAKAIYDHQKYSVMETNQPTRMPGQCHPAVWRHLLSGLIVFALGVGADIGIVEWLHHRHHKVKWLVPAPVVEDYVVQTNVFSGPEQVYDIGVLDDGTVVWRLKK